MLKSLAQFLPPGLRPGRKNDAKSQTPYEERHPPGKEYCVGDDLIVLLPPTGSSYGSCHFQRKQGKKPAKSCDYAATLHRNSDSRLLKTLWIAADSFAEADAVLQDWIRAHCGQEPVEVLSSRVPGTEHLSGINWPFSPRERAESSLRPEQKRRSRRDRQSR